MARLNILCRIGIHRWKPVFRTGWRSDSRVRILENGRGKFYVGPCWNEVAHKCTCCGKRKPY